MTMSDFVEFQKIARLSREIVVTEKIDGTNAQVFIRVLLDDEVMPTDTPIVAVRGNLLIYAGSRNRWLLPGKPVTSRGQTVYNDNFGFATWVKDRADELAQLGEGRHYGEWWGSGIQRGYGLPSGEKRFSLFNVARWADDRDREKFPTDRPACCHVVPVLYRGPFDTQPIEEALSNLEVIGSKAAPGFGKPEGIVIYHTAGNVLFKKTIEKDDEPKSRVA
jgi:hypothetical protein